MGYVFFLGVYRGLFILNWVYRAMYDRYYYSTGWIETIFGTLQTVVYCIFFVVYIKMYVTLI